jgi:polysaccharide pyruvyl transferase WcaK-like protein
MQRADLVVDLSGISFVDGRGYGILAYNVLLVLMPSLLGTPVLKFSQALGPFNNPLNRAAAKLTLPLVTRIAPRGAITARFLRELGIDEDKLELCADSAFAMQVSDESRTAAAPYLEHPAFERDVVSLSISSVVYEYCREEGIDYPGIMADLTRYLLDEGYGVILVPHSTRPGKTSLKNNDLPVCDEIMSRLSSSTASSTEAVCYPKEAMHADTLRVLIGACRFMVASRFHAMISSLAMGVPSLLVGWSHKYAEVLAMFDLEDLAMDYSVLNADGLRKAFDRLVADEDRIRDKIREHLPQVVDSSRNNARMAVRILEGARGR